MRNQSFFASSEAETCSVHILTTNGSFAIMLVVLKCTHRYASHNVIYVLKILGFIITCERPLIWDYKGSGGLSWSKYIVIKLDISIGCYFTVCRAKKLQKLVLFCLRMKGQQCGLHCTATLFVLPFHHLQGSRFLSFYATPF